MSLDFVERFRDCFSVRRPAKEIPPDKRWRRCSIVNLFIHFVVCLKRQVHSLYHSKFSTERESSASFFSFHYLSGMVKGGSNMTGTDCGLFTHKSVPVIFEPPCILEQHFSTAGPRVLLELITNLNVILYLSTCHTVYVIALILFMIMP